MRIPRNTDKGRNLRCRGTARIYGRADKTADAVFCNPPYGREIGKWVKKAYEEARGGGYAVVLLIPARTDTTYFHDYIYGKAEIRFVRGRLRFTDDEGNASDPAPFPSMVVIYNGERVKQ